MLVLNIDTILVERDGKKQRYERGEDVSDAPVDQLEAMIRLGQAVEYDPKQVVEQTPEKVDEQEEADDGVDDGIQAEAGDWKNLPIASLELDEATGKLLIESQLTTVQMILEFGTEHGSLTTIDGIGEGREREIQAAITKVKGE